MRKQIYVSADYSEDDGDREVVEVLNKWGEDELHKVNFLDMSKVRTGSVSTDPDCRPCDLKEEFNRQINVSSMVIFIVGNRTAIRTAGQNCSRMNKQQTECQCTPYKQNVNGSKPCKIIGTCDAKENVGNINTYSYLRHEFEQAKKRGKQIVILYNSLRNESNWLPNYMAQYHESAKPFWIKSNQGDKIANYSLIKSLLGYE